MSNRRFDWCLGANLQAKPLSGQFCSWLNERNIYPKWVYPSFIFIFLSFICNNLLVHFHDERHFRPLFSSFSSLAKKRIIPVYLFKCHLKWTDTKYYLLSLPLSLPGQTSFIRNANSDEEEKLEEHSTITLWKWFIKHAYKFNVGKSFSLLFSFLFTFYMIFMQITVMIARWFLQAWEMDKERNIFTCIGMMRSTFN